MAGGNLDDSYDEAVDTDGRARRHYRTVLDTIAQLGVAQLRSREAGIEQEQRADNVTFRVTGQTRAQLFPVDLVPRMVTAQEWGQLSQGLAQRARALDAFLRDVYSEQAIVADGIIGVQALDRAPGFRSTGRLAGDTVRAHISGTDIVCDRAGRWMVLEDNLRVPSGLAYAIVNHRLMGKHIPELQPPVTIEDPGQTPRMLLETLRAAAPAHAPDEPTVVILSAGCEDSAWFEHTFLAEEMDVPLVQPADLTVSDGKLLQHIGSNVRRIDVVYARMDEDMLLFFHRIRRRAPAAGTACRDRRRPSHHCQCAGERRGRRQGDLRLCPGDHRVLPRRETQAGPGADLDLRRARPA